MKVVHLCTVDTGNGAAVAAHRLHRGLLRMGHDSTMFVAESRSVVNDPTVSIFSPPRDLPSRLRRRFRQTLTRMSLAQYRRSRSAGYEIFSDDRSPHGADLLAQIPACDVINIHAMLNFVDYQAFFAAVPQRTPVVRTLHDMSFFTGGCHYDAGCGRYVERCGACPQLGSSNAEDLSRQIWQRKHSALKNVNRECLYLVTPSHWLAKEARRSSILQNFSVKVIPYGLDTEDFCPRHRTVAREILGISPTARVLLFVAEPITRRAKGFALLVQALSGMGEVPNLLLVSVGSGKPPAEVKIPHLRLGHIGNDRLLSQVYSAADVLVIPSLQDNLPQTPLEAMACGTPVIGFAVGGIPDVVRPGVTGVLVPPGDTTALRDAIWDLLRDPGRREEMATNCRRMAVKEYALEVQAQRYVELYETILTSH